MNNFHDMAFMTFRSCSVRLCCVIETTSKAVIKNCQRLMWVMETVGMSLKRIIGLTVVCGLMSEAASAAPTHADYESARIVKTAVSCGEYKALTGLDLCDVQANVMMAETRYDELVQTQITGSCLDRVQEQYGTLQCDSLGDAFQAWKGRDVTMCERAVLQCDMTHAADTRTRVTIERAAIPTHRARFMRLGSAKAVETR